MPSRNPLEPKLQEAEGALALAEAKIQEQREVMTDLLLQIGAHATCAHCGAPVFWVIIRGADAIMFNVDGSQHWPRCKSAERPRRAAAGE